jgi:cytochrome c553
MADIAKRLSDADVHALSTWLSSQSVPVVSRAAAHKPPLAPAAKEIRCGSAPW